MKSISGGLIISFWSAIIDTSCYGFTTTARTSLFGKTTTVKRALNDLSVLRATPQDAIATLDASQTMSVNKIAATFPTLASNADYSWFAEDGVTIAGCSATLDGREAPGANGNVGWMSSLCVQSKVSSLSIYNGPLTDVPHLISRCFVVNDNTLALYLDFRPRGYGAYEKKDANGNYPGPDELGRAAFEYSGNRMEYEKKFGNDDLVNYRESTLASFEGVAGSFQAQPTELDLLTRGPLLIDVTMPLTDANVAAIAAAREKAVDFWIGWAMDDQHTHRPGAPVNSQYVYDTKYKQNSYGALLAVYTQLFGADDGAKLTAADSGPLDEAYVGGGS